MNELIIFNNPRFGEVRTITEKGKALFCAKDVAMALGYKDSTNAIKQHCKGVVKRHLLSDGGNQLTNFIPEGDIYRLAAKSQLPGAEEFESWIFDEVLPSIRKTGEYVTPKRAQQRLGEVNSAARIIRQTLKEAGMAPQFVAVAMKSLYAPVGVEIPLIGITAEKRTYDASTIAKKLGVFSKSGNPHGQAISAIIAQISVDASEKELVPFQNQTSGHSGECVQYTESVIEKISAWLEQYGYPTEVKYNGKAFKVVYQSVAA